MKLKELRFKVITGTIERNRAIQETLFAKGGKWINKDRYIEKLNSLALCHNVVNASNESRNNLTYSDTIEHYLSILGPEVTYQQALDLIAQVEVPEPEKVFDIKPFDRVIYRVDAHHTSNWVGGFFSLINHGKMWIMGENNSACYLAKYEGNEKFIGAVGFEKNKNDYPEGWWECKDGKPVWIKRD